MTYDLWEVVCDCPDGGDVIEGRHPPVITQHETAMEASVRAGDWYRSGPNGPVRTARVLRNGVPYNTRTQLGPVCPVRLEVHRDHEGWWHCSAVTPDGRKLSASYGISITRDDALLAGRQWAEDRAFYVT